MLDSLDICLLCSKRKNFWLFVKPNNNSRELGLHGERIEGKDH